MKKKESKSAAGLKNLVDNTDGLCRQAEMSLVMIRAMNKEGINAETCLRLQFFFTVERKELSEELAETLRNRGYTADILQARERFLVSGWSSPVSMTEEVVLSWTIEMMQLASRFESEFGGWGTFAGQEGQEEFFSKPIYAWKEGLTKKVPG